MEILIKTLQFILSLSLLVIAHEMGHFIFAKLFKTRVEKFYLFFDPWFSLFKIKKGETEYGIGWLPLGGYVKISGMIDESMDKEQLKQPQQPWEFRSKTKWQRLLIMVGGVVVNFILALFIFAMILFKWGEEFVPMKNAIYGYEFCETALQNGFQNGDKIIAVDGQEYEFLADATHRIIFDNAKLVTVERTVDTAIIRLTLQLPADFTKQYLDGKEGLFAIEFFPWIVDKAVSGSPADKAGLTHGDAIVAVNDKLTPSANMFITEIKDNAGKEIKLTIIRDKVEQFISLTVAADGKIGVYSQQVLETKRIEYSFWASFPAGIKKGINTLTQYVKSMKLVFTKEGIKQLGGPIAIGNIFPATWDWAKFWYMTAFLSLILAFMNILPIPALDGGHVLFLLFEIITGKKPSDKFLEKAQMVGMILLIGLMVFAFGNDIIRLFK